MKKLDLSKLKLEMIDGSIKEFDISKELAQIIFQQTQKINEHDFAIKLYNNPIIELKDDNREIIKEYVSKYFKAFVKIAIFKLMGEEYENN